MRLALSLLALAAAPISAQENADKARIDDFAAAPASKPDVALGQVAADDSAIAPEQKIDRTVATEQPRASGAPQNLVQVGTRSNGPPLSQVGTAGDRSPVVSPALSEREAGRPTATERLTGADRCDPQAQDANERALCRRILELRAREFSATAAPVLSPEQELLARQQSASLTLAEAFGQARTADNADERAAQELGFIALNQPRPAEPAPEEQPAEGSLSEALKGVLVQMGVPQP